MRTLDRNKRIIWYAQQTGVEEVKDSNGFATGEKNAVYSKPKMYWLNVGRDTGNTTFEQYGTAIPYTRTLITSDMHCPINEQTVLWIDKETTSPYNYVVTNVSVLLNHIQITAQRVKI